VSKDIYYKERPSRYCAYLYWPVEHLADKDLADKDLADEPQALLLSCTIPKSTKSITRLRHTKQLPRDNQSQSTCGVRTHDGVRFNPLNFQQ